MKSVEKIHLEGKSIFSFPFKIYYAKNGTEEKTNLIISVPKKIYKRAVRRNLVRRRIREAFRLSDQNINAAKGLDILLVYISPEILEYGRIADTLTEALSKMEK